MDNIGLSQGGHPPADHSLLGSGHPAPTTHLGVSGNLGGTVPDHVCASVGHDIGFGHGINVTSHVSGCAVDMPGSGLSTGGYNAGVGFTWNF